MNIIVPMAGSDELFQQKGYSYPKNFIEIMRKPLFQCVYENLSLLSDTKFIFIVKHEDVLKYHLDRSLKLLVPDCEIIVQEDKTAGAACSVLLAAKYIDNDDSLIVANGDQIILTNICTAIDTFKKENADGGIITFESVHPRWSYVKLNKDNVVIEAAEKRPISKCATAGFYYFEKGSDFVHAAMEMIRKDANVDGKYFVCPVYNEMILNQKKIITYQINPEQYFSLSSPEGIEEYENFLKSKS